MNIWESRLLPKSEKQYHELVLFSLSESLVYSCMIIFATAALSRQYHMSAALIMSISLTAVLSLTAVCTLFFGLSVYQLR